MVALHSWCFKLEMGNFVQFSTYPETNKKAFLEFGASLCHRNSKKPVVKSCRKLFIFLLKSQNSPEIQAKQKQYADRPRKRHFRLLYSPRKVKNFQYHLARLSKWIINLTNLDWNGNYRNKVYLAKY